MGLIDVHYLSHPQMIGEKSKAAALMDNRSINIPDAPAASPPSLDKENARTRVKVEKCQILERIVLVIKCLSPFLQPEPFLTFRRFDLELESMSRLTFREARNQ